MGDPAFIGVDLGGTQLRMAAVTRAGCVASEILSVPTGREFGPDDLRRELLRLGAELRASLNGRPVAALGFGTAGVVGAGPLSQSENLPLLNGVDIGVIVQEASDCPVALENDARCFTLAEARYGAARGASDVCGITLGTGVGSGALVGGRLLRGAAAQAGEVWRLPLRGRHFESFLSGAGIVRGYEEAGGSVQPGLDAARIAECARLGDEAARTAWRAFGEDLALLCEYVMSILDPAIIVIGGSISLSWDLYSGILDAHAAKHPTRIVRAELGQAAGVIGAAALNLV
jgi:glucokinase